ncbi:hypothetical protein A1Q2_04557 [Trichosporon asahii var. asahii CBS 8904]|uniref:Uncharacterized protein n=1 Tax=Trichosporon asahii var. asahii (strain CBS 8904) TaxID=1220162 RepID=K1WHZ5_TRIAC|nr:hypothetical protein A1Q2_04557 [Trichosporon asahii var. asahii CBS 8904]
MSSDTTVNKQSTSSDKTTTKLDNLEDVQAELIKAQSAYIEASRDHIALLAEGISHRDIGQDRASPSVTSTIPSDQCALHSSVQVKSTTLGFAFSIQLHLSPSRPPSSQHSHSVVVCLAPMTNYRHSHRHAHASLPPAFQQAQSPLPTPPSSAQAFGHTYPANSSQPTGPSPSAIPQPGASIMTTGPRTPEP